VATIHIVSIGKLKDKHVQTLESDYLKRFKDPKINLHELKGHQENIDLEMKEISLKLDQLKKNKSIEVFIMTEHGKTYNSVNFSNLFFKYLELSKDVVFVIGGAAGFSKEFLAEFKNLTSLSPMTFPHRLARLLLIEQIYRAYTINKGHPYHKD